MLIAFASDKGDVMQSALDVLKTVCVALGMASGLGSLLVTFVADKRTNTSSKRVWYTPLLWRSRTQFTEQGWRYRNIALWLNVSAVGLLYLGGIIL
jgi:hypothetical protein